MLYFFRLLSWIFWLPDIRHNRKKRFQRIVKVVLRLRVALGFMALGVAVGTVGYVLIEGYSWFDAYYMSIITLASVGFGEVHPLSMAGRAFTSGLIIFNVGLFAYAISTITSLFAEGGLTKLLHDFRMIQRVKALKGHTIVCGFGRHATEVSQELAKQNIPFVLIENNAAKLEYIREFTPYIYVEGDATEDSILQEAGIEQAAALVVTLPSDADNLFIVLTARHMNKDLRIISRANAEADEVKLKRAGADHVVMPERIGGFYMATLVNKPDLVEFFTLISNMGPSNVVFEEIPVGDLKMRFQNRSIGESRLSEECRVPIVAVRMPNGQYELNPPPGQMLYPDMHIVVLGNPDQMAQFKALAFAK